MLLLCESMRAVQLSMLVQRIVAPEVTVVALWGLQRHLEQSTRASVQLSSWRNEQI